MNRFNAFALIAALSFSPMIAAAAERHECTPAEQGAAKLSSSGLSCIQWVAQFNGASSDTQTARNDRAAAPHS